MSILIDPPWLYANGAATTAAFRAVSGSPYLDLRWTKPIRRACCAQDRRDWMLDSGVFHCEHRRAGAATHAISAALLASCPLWLLLGWDHGRR
jgi:hypothetical protein